ncbi:MAG: PLP-dependent transferase [Deltaproteobacteria bacterium]|nr:PLP-dependent transferase [Deltaproteobacteria bacterium]
MTRPRLETMSATTRALHDAVNANAPFLHPERRTIQRDLVDSTNVVSWQEAKARFIALGDGAWSELPHLYARYGTPGTADLIAELRRLEHATCGFVTDCGMQAVALVADVLLTHGAHAVVMRQVYNKTRSFFEASAKRVGGSIALVDDGDLDALAAALRPETRFVFAETYTNPLTRAQDIPALVELTHRIRGARLVLDTTIVSPWGLRTRPLDQGVDVVVTSMTKSVGGQDTALGGYIATNDAELGNQVMDLIAMRGGILDDERARRVTQNLALAEKNHARRCETATKVAAYLAAHPRIERAFHPSLADHPDAAVIARDYTRPGSLLAFRVRDVDEAGHGVLADRLVSTGVPRYALSFDGLVTKVNHHKTVSEYFTPPDVVKRLGIDRLIRLGIGLEDADDLIACLDWTLQPTASS